MSKNIKKQVLIISHDKIGNNMAGPGIRYHYMAETLSKKHDVTVGFFDKGYLPGNDFERTYKTLHIDPSQFESVFNNKQVIISMWLNQPMINYCNNNLVFVVFDMYAPVPVENLALYLYNGATKDASIDHTYEQSNYMFQHFLTNGDLFLTSNRRQTDFWIGYLFGVNQVNVSGYEKRSFYDRFVSAPMGIDTSIELKQTAPVMGGVMDGINKDDKILLWTGGIWNWFDAQSLIKAMKKLENTYPNVKLVFFGTKHPNPDVPEMQESVNAFSLAKELGILDKNVFLKDGWVAYPDRINYLMEADVAINTTKHSIESEFSHRTRVLDHLLAKLPTISTAGDYLSDEVISNYNLGVAVSPHNEQAIADAIVSVLDAKNHKKMVENIDRVRNEFDWEQTLKPLADAIDSNMAKLPYVDFIQPTHPTPKGRVASFAKKILPRSVKKAILRVYKYVQ